MGRSKDLAKAHECLASPLSEPLGIQRGEAEGTRACRRVSRQNSFPLFDKRGESPRMRSSSFKPYSPEGVPRPISGEERPEVLKGSDSDAR